MPLENPLTALLEPTYCVNSAGILSLLATFETLTWVTFAYSRPFQVKVYLHLYPLLHSTKYGFSEALFREQ